jgi:hypothetical protein
MRFQPLKERLRELGEQLLPGNQVIAFGVFMLFYLCLNWGPPAGQPVLPGVKKAPPPVEQAAPSSLPPVDSLRYAEPDLISPVSMRLRG